MSERRSGEMSPVENAHIGLLLPLIRRLRECVGDQAWVYESDGEIAELILHDLGVQQVGWRKVHDTPDGPVDDICPMSKYRTDYEGAGYEPVYRLNASLIRGDEDGWGGRA